MAKSKATSSVKNCKKGYACGASCISEAYDCIKDLPKLAKPYLDQLKKQSLKNQIKFEVYEHIKEGDWDSEEYLNYVRKSRLGVIKRKFNRLPEEEKEFYQKYVDSLDNSVKVRLFMLNPEKYPKPSEDALDKPMIREATQGLAKRLVDNTKEKYPDFDSAIAGLDDLRSGRNLKPNIDEQAKIAMNNTGLDPESLGRTVQAFDDLTQGQMDKDKMPGKITYTQSRAYVQSEKAEAGHLNIGFPTSASYNKLAMFHELGHVAEFHSPRIRKLSYSLREEMATSDEIKSMNELKGVSHYGREELAYPSRFSNPYIGKYYRPTVYKAEDTVEVTEIFSSGMEKMSSKSTMRELYEEDPELFYYTVGIIRKENVF